MILVLVEHGPDGVTEASLEALRFARDLGAAGGGIPVDTVSLGAPGGEVDAETSSILLGSHGVRRSYVVGGDAAGGYAAAAWAAAVAAVRAESGSVVVLATGSPRGNEVLAHVATRLDVPMAANVVSFAGLAPFVVTRQVVGGSALEEMRLGSRPAVLSVAGHAVEAVVTGGAPAEVVHLAPPIDAADLRARVVSTSPGLPDASGGLRSARLVIGAGRGAGGPEGFSGVDDLAALLGGVVGVSRVVTSLGWRPHHEQVGQTGSRISPELYIACGISGAIQHWAGCASSQAILAVNTDAEAPMMTKATYAVVGDMHEVVPAVIEEIQARRG